jgi:hypothetical protein
MLPSHTNGKSVPTHSKDVPTSLPPAGETVADGFILPSKDRHRLPFLFYKENPTNVFTAVGAESFKALVDKPINHRKTNELILSMCFYVEKRGNILRRNGGDTKRSYSCKCPGCPWKLSLQRSLSAKNALPDNPFFLRQEPVAHADFCMTTNVTTQQHVLRNSKKLWSLLEEDPGLVFSSTKKQLLPEIDIRKMADGAYAEVRKVLIESIREQNILRYGQLPKYLEEWVDLNKGATAALQVDDEGRFCRMFVATDQAVRSHNNGAVSSVHIVDGGHSKTQMYDGCHMVLVGKDGNGRNVPQAYGWIPSEQVVANLCWFMQMVVRAGFPLNHVPMFTDRGHLLNAAVVLQSIGIFLNLKYCLEHIFSNVFHNFKLSGLANESTRKVIRSKVSALQASQSPNRMIQTVQDLVGALPDNIAVGVALYLLSIDPIHWIVFANHPRFNRSEYVGVWLDLVAGLIIVLAHEENPDAPMMGDDEAGERACAHIKSVVPIGVPAPTHEITRTNSAEGENRASLFSYRALSPPRGLEDYLLKTTLRLLNFHETAVLFSTDPMEDTYTAVALRNVLAARKLSVNWLVVETNWDSIQLDVVLEFHTNSTTDLTAAYTSGGGRIHTKVDKHDEHEEVYQGRGTRVRRHVTVHPTKGVTCDCCRMAMLVLICPCGYRGLIIYRQLRNENVFNLIKANCHPVHLRSVYVEQVNGWIFQNSKM